MSLRIRLLFAAAQLAASVSSMPALAQDAPAAPPGAGRFVERFNAANTTHDGRLTLAQAQAAHMGGMVKAFSAIDAQNKGYVTLDDVRAFRSQQKAAHAARTPPGAPQ